MQRCFGTQRLQGNLVKVEKVNYAGSVMACVWNELKGTVRKEWKIMCEDF